MDEKIRKTRKAKRARKRKMTEKKGKPDVQMPGVIPLVLFANNFSSQLPLCLPPQSPCTGHTQRMLAWKLFARIEQDKSISLLVLEARIQALSLSAALHLCYQMMSNPKRRMLFSKANAAGAEWRRRGWPGGRRFGSREARRGGGRRFDV